MKRIYLFFIITILVCVSTSAQIQRNFFDFQLGVTTQDEVRSYLQSKGKTINYDSNCMYVNNMRFGGETWSSAYFKFYDDILFSVAFIQTEMTTTRKFLDNTFKHFKTNLNKKYSNYYNSKSSNDEISNYDDQVTDVLLRYSNYQGVQSLLLMYSDLETMKAIARNDGDEL